MAPEEYDPVYMNQLIKILQDFLDREQATQRYIDQIGFDNVPTARGDANIGQVFLTGEQLNVRTGV
jgi:hypothetical protein